MNSLKQDKQTCASRFDTRWLFLAAAIVLLVLGGAVPSLAIFLPSLSPFVTIGSLMTLKTVSLVMLPSLGVLLLMIGFSRWFCRNACPVGLLQECVAKRRWGPDSAGSIIPVLGPWILCLTLGAALLGFPFFLWLDPLAILAGFLNSLRLPMSPASMIGGTLFLFVLLLAVIMPRVWCAKICPLGAFQDVIWQGRCLLKKQGASQGRRHFLALSSGAVMGFLYKTARGESKALLRPPGSVVEFHFNGVCVRCGNCSKACPSGIISPELGHSGIERLLTPGLSFENGYCREDCHRCNQVCPSGAIARMDLHQKRQSVIGVAKVILDACLLANGRECVACIQRCPYEAIVKTSHDGGFTSEPSVKTERCNGCGACEMVCPVRPTRAISVVAGEG